MSQSRAWSGFHPHGTRLLGPQPSARLGPTLFPTTPSAPDDNRSQRWFVGQTPFLSAIRHQSSEASREDRSLIGSPSTADVTLDVHSIDHIRDIRTARELAKKFLPGFGDPEPIGTIAHQPEHFETQTLMRRNADGLTDGECLQQGDFLRTEP